MIPQAAIQYIKDAVGCICGAAIRVVVMDGCDPVDWTAIGGGGGGPGGGNQGPGDLEVVCDADGNQIFIKTVIDADGNCCFINPVDLSVLVPGVDFFPCPPQDNAELIACVEQMKLIIGELKDCVCAPCPEGFDPNKWGPNGNN